MLLALLILVALALFVLGGLTLHWLLVAAVVVILVALVSGYRSYGPGGRL